MKRLVLCALLIFGTATGKAVAQAASTAALGSPAKAATKPPARPAAKPAAKDPLSAALGGNNLAPGQAITTEIFADEAFFDSANHIGIFSGRVIVNDPRFNVQADKLTIYLAKTEPAGQNATATPSPRPGDSFAANQGLEKAVAEGNVGVVRDRPGENGGPPSRSVGRADMAIYTAKDGNVELRGTPRVQSGSNTHVATSPDTVMVINQNGQLVTRGPSRTEIRQEAADTKKAGAPAAPKP